MTTLVVAGLGTFITGASDASLVDLKLLAPCIQKYVRAKDHTRKSPKKSHPNQNVILEVDEKSIKNKDTAL